MNNHVGSDQAPGVRPGLRGIVAGAALVVGMASIPAFAATASAATGTVIATATTPFGRALVVGSGPYAGFSLYFITSDHGRTFGCTSKPVVTPVGTLLCTGPSNDINAEWPAITTTGSPIAGPGASQQLLGTVWRAGVGDQVTYAGHPLYLFDQGPGQITGEGWDEPSLPPWHGQWWLVNPDGNFQEWSQTLTTSTLADHAVPLSALMLTGAGYHVVRYAGTDRFATAVAVAGALGNPGTVLLASGENYPDALAAGPAAAHVHGAVLLTDGSVIPAATASYLTRATTVYAIGGPAAAADPTATAVFGGDRYETAAAVASKFFSAPATAGVATGLSFPDALSGGAELALLGGPLLLASQGSVPFATANYLSQTRTITAVRVYGGAAVLADSVLTQLQAIVASV